VWVGVYDPLLFLDMHAAIQPFLLDCTFSLLKRANQTIYSMIPLEQHRSQENFFSKLQEKYHFLGFARENIHFLSIHFLMNIL
jgi:hypothetical protein